MQPEGDDVKKALERLIKSNVSYEPKDGAAEGGDRLTMRLQGERGHGHPLRGRHGRGCTLCHHWLQAFHSSFRREPRGRQDTARNASVSVTFPDDYQAKHLAGKNTEFDVTAKEVAKPVEAKADDEFADAQQKSFAKLEEAIRGQLQKELDTSPGTS